MTKAKSKKRILIVCQHFWPETFRINDIADFLANEKDCEIEVLCGLPNYPSGTLAPGYSVFKNRKQTHNSIKIERVLEIPRGNNSNIRIFLNYISFPFFSLFHIPRLLTRKYDHVFLYQLSPVMMSVAGLIVSKLKRIPSTMYVLDLWPENLYSVLDIKNPTLRSIAARVSTWHYKKADKLIALSDVMRHRLLEVTKKSPDSIVVLPQAAEKIYESSRSDKALSKRFETTFNIVYTGNISPAQSFDTLIDSAEQIVKSGIKDIRWVIVGDGMSKKDVEASVQSKGLGQYFSFEGQQPIESMPTYTHVADVFIGCLVKSELLEATIPAKVLSYIASGKPIVLAMNGEVQDLINRDIRCGFAGNAEDTKALTKNIKKLYALTKKQRDELGNKAKQYHHKHFERTLILTKLYNFMFTDSKV